MSSRCAQEMCNNWSGDGRVCPCALFGVEGDRVRDDAVLDAFVALFPDLPFIVLEQTLRSIDSV